MRQYQQMQKIQKQIRICFNPKCKTPERRIFQQQLSHKQCKNWVTCSFEKCHQTNNNINKTAFNLNIDFISNPIGSLKQLHAFRNNFNIKDIIETSYRNIKETIDLMLQETFSKIFNQIINITQNGAKIYQTIITANLTNKDSINNQTNFIINEQKFISQLKSFQEIGSISLINEAIIQNKIRNIGQSIQALHNGFIDFEADQTATQRHKSYKSYQQATQYLSNPNEQVLSKLQTLTSIFKTSIPQLTVTPLAQSKQLIEIKCYICEEPVKKIMNITPQTGNRQKRKQCGKELLKHLMQQHQKVIYHQYLNKVLKHATYCISMKTFIKQISTYPNKKFVVIDRENANKFQLTFDQVDNFYVIQVLSKATVGLAKGRYMIADSTGKDAADLLSILLLYEISKVPGASAYLITNDHYGITLKPIMKSLGFEVFVHGAQFIDYRMPKC